MRIDYTPSLAFYIWQSFRKSLWETVTQPADVADIWVISADICSTQGCIAASIADSSQFLHALLALKPLQTIPAEALLYGLYSSSNQSDHLIPPQVEPVARTLLLFAQLLAAVAAERDRLFPGTTVPMASSDIERSRHIIASKLYELTELNGCAPVLLSDPTARTQTGVHVPPLPEPSRRIRRLRSAVLIFKLATLTFNVKADLVGHHDPEMPVSVQSLWKITSILAAHTFDKDAAEPSDVTAWSESISQEEHELCVLLCEHSVVTLRQAHKEPQAGMQQQICLQVLRAALDGMRPDLVRGEVQRLGKAANLAAALVCCVLMLTIFCTH